MNNQSQNVDRLHNTQFVTYTIGIGLLYLYYHSNGRRENLDQSEDGIYFPFKYLGENLAGKKYRLFVADPGKVGCPPKGMIYRSEFLLAENFF